jgi:hypothetical protein
VVKNKIKIMKPYKENILENGVIQRTFDKDVDATLLEWHRDKRDRLVKVINETDWKFQYDNELPINLKEGDTFKINKETYHRIIKGNKDLVIEIFETDFNEERPTNYMFFQNLKSIKHHAEMLLSKSPEELDSIISGGHDWASEHIATAKDDLEEVCNFFTHGMDVNEGINEKDDRCTRIAKRKYDTWPSAYASGAVVKCRKGDIWKDIKEEDIPNLKKEEITEKTDYSKEKDKGLHGWFERQGGEGKSSGWVDCNTCRKDSKTGKKKCKPCGRKEGEKRSKYPACRPTPSACGTKGKGDKWGKKSKTNEGLHNTEKNSIFVENLDMKDVILYKLHEATETAPVKPKVVPETKPSPIRRRIWEVRPSVKPKPKMEENKYVMNLNGKEIDEASLEVDGVYTSDYPDFSDAYFSNASFIDGTPLSDDELDQLGYKYGDVLSTMAYESLF